mmetsp:Transcript_39329/g.123976  ORF Transcript_39329/g.123976 Transcript_39329/m.123976 type:complete len:295 (+) Transcript_39329:148-1032(+)
MLLGRTALVRVVMHGLVLLGMRGALSPAVNPGDDEASKEHDEAGGVLDEEGLGEEDVGGKHAHKLATDAHAGRHNGTEALDTCSEGVASSVGQRDCCEQPEQRVGIRLYSLLEELQLPQEEGDDGKEDRTDPVSHEDHLSKRTVLPVQCSLLQRAHRRLRRDGQQHHPNPSHRIRPLRLVPDLVGSGEHVQSCDREGGGCVLSSSKPLFEDDQPGEHDDDDLGALEEENSRVAQSPVAHPRQPSAQRDAQRDGCIGTPGDGGEVDGQARHLHLHEGEDSVHKQLHRCCYPHQPD